jgi:hypothetical protein
LIRRAIELVDSLDSTTREKIYNGNARELIPNLPSSS